jgi:ABC-2 type transport system permease protein
MFVAGFKIIAVTHDKVAGIWNRLILSPVTKTGMCLGYLSYRFCVTFLQTLAVMLIYRYALHFDLGDRFELIVAVTRSSPSR